jgi:5-methylcytosine-specific restriction protein A
MRPRPLTPCAEPGCPELTTQTRCPAHHRETRRTADRRRPSSTTRGYDHKWARTRGRYLAHHPICEDGNCTAPAEEVHHLDGLGPLGPLGHKWVNLEALCKLHHGRRTAHDQPAGWNAR